MATSFVDTSALLKLYLAQIGSAWMSAAVLPGGIVISEITIAEVGSVPADRSRVDRWEARGRPPA